MRECWRRVRGENGLSLSTGAIAVAGHSQLGAGRAADLQEPVGGNDEGEKAELGLADQKKAAWPS